MYLFQLRVDNHFYLQSISQMGHVSPGDCPGPGKFGEAPNICRAIDVPAAQS